MTNLIQADRLYIGSNQATAVYVGSTKVWPAFKPNDLAGLAFWLDASTLNLADGASVTSWNNNGNIIGPDVPIFDGYPTLRKNALASIMPCIRTTSPTRIRFVNSKIDRDYTFVYVARKWSATAGRILSSNYSQVNTPNTLYGFWDTWYDCAHVEGWLGGASEPSVPATTAWKLYSGDSSTSTVARLFSNGGLLRSGTAPSPKGFYNTLLLGGYSDGTTERPDYELCEFVMYNRLLPDVDRRKVEQYMRARYGF
jgi:hypothetical protein